MTIDDPATLASVAEMFARYEQALGSNDIAALDAFFWDSPQTVRYGVGEALYGIMAIRAFRQARAGGSPPRTLAHQAITTFGEDFAITNTEFHRTGEARRGRQSQVWVRFADVGWRIVAAHVSLAAETS
ncbi:oxalurate catabolism protein HpxZ [Acidiphilium sp. PA]|nr:oxalurate catabolism protein HpxZ [Acidiphilium sp. PA]